MSKELNEFNKLNIVYRRARFNAFVEISKSSDDVARNHIMEILKSTPQGSGERKLKLKAFFNKYIPGGWTSENKPLASLVFEGAFEESKLAEDEFVLVHMPHGAYAYWSVGP